MADESQYSSDAYSNKQKYEEQTAPPPSPRSPTGFSSGPSPSASPDPVAASVLSPSFYDSVPPLTDEIQREIAARLNSGEDAYEIQREIAARLNSSYPSDGKQLSAPASKPVYGTKKIYIPYVRVVDISGERGEVLQILQLDSGAKIEIQVTEIQVTVVLTGTPKQISKAEQLINDILKKAEEGGGQPQEGYQARPPSSWAPPGAPAAQVAGYGYMQPRAYPGPPQYGQSPYGSYPQQGYSSTWDQSGVAPSQQSAQGEYDYYGQQRNIGGQSQQYPGAPGSYGAQSGYPRPAASPPTYGYGQAPPQAYGSYGSYPQAAPTCQAAYSSGYGAPPAYGQRLPRYGAPPAYSSGYGAPPPWLNQPKVD